MPYGDTAWVAQPQKERQTDFESMCFRESNAQMCPSAKRMFFSDLIDFMLHEVKKLRGEDKMLE